jgi:hypothetical protein
VRTQEHMNERTHARAHARTHERTRAHTYTPRTHNTRAFFLFIHNHCCVYFFSRASAAAASSAFFWRTPTMRASARAMRISLNTDVFFSSAVTARALTWSVGRAKGSTWLEMSWATGPASSFFLMTTSLPRYLWGRVCLTRVDVCQRNREKSRIWVVCVCKHERSYTLV